MKPVNLDVLINRTTTFTIKGNEIKVPELTNKEFNELLEIELITEGRELTKKQIAFVQKKLNQNSSNIKFNDKDMENLNRSAMLSIWNTLAVQSNNTAIDPN